MTDPAQSAAHIILAALDEAGLHRAAGDDPEIRAWWNEWVAGEIGRREFIERCKEWKLKIGKINSGESS